MYNNSYASLDDFEYHVTDDCMLKPPAADPDSCGDDQFLCREEKQCIPIVSSNLVFDLEDIENYLTMISLI